MLGKDNLKRGGGTGGGNCIQKTYLGDLSTMYCGLGLSISGSGTAYFYDTTTSVSTTTSSQNFTTSLETDPSTGVITIDGTPLDTKWRLHSYTAPDAYVQITSSSNGFQPFSNNDGVLFIGGDPRYIVYYKIENNVVSLTNQIDAGSYYTALGCVKISDTALIAYQKNAMCFSLIKISGNTLTLAKGSYNMGQYGSGSTCGCAVQRLDDKHFAVCYHLGGYNNCQTAVLELNADDTDFTVLQQWTNYQVYNGPFIGTYSIPNMNNTEQHEQQVWFNTSNMAVCFVYKIVNGSVSITKQTGNAFSWYNGYSPVYTKDWFGHDNDGAYYFLLRQSSSKGWVVRQTFSNSTSGGATSSVLHDITLTSGTDTYAMFYNLQSTQGVVYCIRQKPDTNIYLCAGIYNSIYKIGEYVVYKNDGTTLTNAINVDVLSSGANWACISITDNVIKYYMNTNSYIKRYDLNT